MQKKLKISMQMIVLVILCLFTPSIVKAYTSEEVGEAFATYAENVIQQGNQKGILRYSQRHRTSGYNWEKVTDSRRATTNGGKEGEIITGNIAFDCSSFCSRVYTYVTGGVYNELCRSGEFKNLPYLKTVPIQNAQRGDILWKSGHVGIYLGDGKTAEAAGLISRGPTEQCTIVENGLNAFKEAYRLKDEYVAQITELHTDIDWEAVGETATSSSSTNSTAGFYYNGLAKRVEFVAYQNPNALFPKLSDLADYIIGTITLGIKIQLIGWTSIFENMITEVVEGITGTPVVVEEVETEEIGETVTEETEETTQTPEESNVKPTTQKLNAEEAGLIIAKYAEDLVKNHRSEFVYSLGSYTQAYRGIKTSGWAKGTSTHYPGKQFRYTNKYAVDCHGFVNMVIHQGLGIGSNTKYTQFYNAGNGFERITRDENGKKLTRQWIKENGKPGDIIKYRGHYAIYLGNGQTANAVNRGSPKPSSWTIHIDGIWSYEILYIARITETKAASIDINGVKSEFRSIAGTTTAATTAKWVENLETPRNIEDNKLTIEKIIYNKVPLLDVNIFNFKDAADMELTPENVIYIIKKNVANWYYTFRNITIIGLLLVLIYIGLRMALSTIASDKAKYTRLFVNWLVSFIIVFFIHFYMLAVLLINEQLVGLVSKQGYKTEEVEVLKLMEETDSEGNVVLDETGNPVKVLKKVKAQITTETSLYNSILEKAYEIKASQGIAGTIMYMFLVYYLLKFLFVYFKRLLTVNILALISPLIAISYAIDKIKDNKSQALGTWMKEFAENVLIQFVHALLYYIFVSVAFDLVFSTSLGGIIIGFVFLNFMLKAENLLFKMFKFGGSTGSLKNLMESTNEFVAGALAIKSMGGGMVKLGAKGVEQAGKAVPAIQRTEVYKSAVHRIQRSSVYRKTIGRQDGGVSDDMLVDYVNEDAKKAKKDAKNAKWKAIKGTAKTGRKIVSNAASFAFAIPQLVANPGIGVQNLIRTSMELKSLLESPEKLKIGRKYQGQRFTVGSKVRRVALGVATLGASEVARGLSNIDQKQQKQVKKVEEKYILAHAYKEALHLEKRLIAEVIEHGELETKYRNMVEKGVDHSQVLPEDIKGITIKSMAGIKSSAEEIAETLEKIGIEVDTEQLGQNIQQVVLNTLGAIAIASTTEQEEKIVELAKKRHEDAKRSKQRVEEEVKKNAKGIHVEGLSLEQTISLAKYQVLYNESYIGSGEAAKQNAVTVLKTEEENVNGELRELESQLQELQERLKTGTVGTYDLQREKSLENRIVELKIDRQMVQAILTAQEETEKVVLIEDGLSHRILKAAEEDEKENEQSKQRVEEAVRKSAKGIHVEGLSLEQTISLAKYQVLYNESYIGSGEAAKQNAVTVLETEEENVNEELRELKSQLQELQERLKTGTVESYDLQREKSIENQIIKLETDRQMIQSILTAQEETEKVVLVEDRASHRILKAAKEDEAKKDAKQEKLEAETIAAEIIQGMSKMEFVEYTYRAWLRDAGLASTSVRKTDIERATEDYINTNTNGNTEQELTITDATEIIESIMRDKGIHRSRQDTEEILQVEAADTAQHVINGQMKKEQEKAEQQVIQEYTMLQEETDLLEIASQMDSAALKEVEYVLSRMQDTEEDLPREKLEKIMPKKQINTMVNTVVKHLKPRDISKLMYAAIEREGSYRKEDLPQEYEPMRQTVERIQEINTFTREKTKKKVMDISRLMDKIMQEYGKSERT